LGLSVIVVRLGELELFGVRLVEDPVMFPSVNAVLCCKKRMSRTHVPVQILVDAVEHKRQQFLRVVLLIACV
jgi:hypothetical protein